MNKLLQIFLLISVGFLAGCGGSSGGGDGGNTPDPVSDPPESSPTTSIKLINRSGTKIYTFHMAPSSSGTWGRDLISMDMIVTETRIVKGVPCGKKYDLRVGNYDVIAVKYGVYISCKSTYEWRITS